MPRFSIILACYQAAATLEDTLASLRAQEFSDWEALCVDDGSSDATYALLRTAAAADPRIRVVETSGQGLAAARNHGAAMARGEILAFCEPGDLWTADKLTRLDAAFSNAQCDAAFGRVSFFRREAGDTRAVTSVPSRTLTIPTLLAETPVWTMSNLALRSEVFDRSGGLRSAAAHDGVLEWLVRLVGGGARVQPIDRVLVHHRVSRRCAPAYLAALRAGRVAALESAARFGVHHAPAAEAAHLRCLARRAIGVGLGGTTALSLALRGLGLAPRGFFSPMHRGCSTLVGALIAPAMPGPVRRAFFSR